MPAVTRHVEQACPHCGHRLNANTPADALETARPKPGDVSVCIGCATALRFRGDMSLVLLERAEFLGLDRETRVLLIKAQHAIISAGWTVPGRN